LRREAPNMMDCLSVVFSYCNTKTVLTGRCVSKKLNAMLSSQEFLENWKRRNFYEYCIYGRWSFKKEMKKELQITQLYLRGKIYELEYLEANVDNFSNDDWKNISRAKNIPIAFYENHLDKLDWLIISYNESIPESFFEKHFDRCNLSTLYWNNNISVEFFINRIAAINFTELCGKHTKFSDKKLKNEIYEKYKTIILENPLTTDIGIYSHVPIEILERRMNDNNWYYLCKNPTAPVEFLEKHINRLNWENITTNEGLPLWFFEKYVDKLYYFIIPNNHSIPAEFYHTFWHKLSQADKIRFLNVL
jgi:hypothetical protein